MEPGNKVKPVAVTPKEQPVKIWQDPPEHPLSMSKRVFVGEVQISAGPQLQFAPGKKLQTWVTSGAAINPLFAVKRYPKLKLGPTFAFTGAVSGLDTRERMRSVELGLMAALTLKDNGKLKPNNKAFLLSVGVRAGFCEYNDGKGNKTTGASVSGVLSAQWYLNSFIALGPRVAAGGCFLPDGTTSNVQAELVLTAAF